MPSDLSGRFLTHCDYFYFDAETNRHKNEINREVCRSTKWMMLHVRDCPGTTACFDVCPFPWCRKVKHLLYHLVSCTEPEQCRICSGSTLPRSMRRLHHLNAHRGGKYREALVAKSRKEAEKFEATECIISNGESCKSRLVRHLNGSNQPSPVASAAEDPELIAAGGAEPTPIGTGHSHRDLNAMADSSNSLAALAAAADVLAAEDFDGDRDSPIDEALVAATVTKDPVDISIPAASGADIVETAISTLSNSCHPYLDGEVSDAVNSAFHDALAAKIEGGDTTFVSEMDATWEVEAELVSSLSPADGAYQNEPSVKMPDGDTSLQSDVDTKPAFLAASLKLEDEIGASNQPLELQCPQKSATGETLATAASGTVEAEKKILDSQSEPSVPPIRCVANAASVVDNSQPESRPRRSATACREPLRVQETIG